MRALRWTLLSNHSVPVELIAEDHRKVFQNTDVREKKGFAAGLTKESNSDDDYEGSSDISWNDSVDDSEESDLEYDGYNSKEEQRGRISILEVDIYSLKVQYCPIQISQCSNDVTKEERRSRKRSLGQCAKRV